MKKIPIGVDNFEALINENCYYVDQTKIIDDLLDRGPCVTLFPRPRRFGKSLMISMLENFFEIERKKKNTDLFKGLYIETSKYYKERGTYPVIALDFKNLKQETWESVYNQFVIMIKKVYVQKNYVFDILDESEKTYYENIKNGTGNIDDYKNSISSLIDYLSRYYNKKVILLIDEYDVPIGQGYLKDYYDKIIDLIKNVLSAALKGNDNLKFAVLTGVLRVSKESIFSDLNNVNVYGLMNSNFPEYFGFKKEETQALLEYYGLKLSNDVKNMYDGYKFNGVNIYNPWSILNYADKKVLSPYWVNTSGNDLIKYVIIKTSEVNRNIIESLTQGQSQEFTYNENLTYKDFDNYDNVDILLNLFFSSGYLTIDRVLDEESAVLKIPNNEVKKIITNFLALPLLGDRTDIGRYIRDDIINEDLKALEEHLNELFQKSSYIDSYEAFYHGSMFGLFATCLPKEYIVKSNRETGKGRCDILIEKIDKKLGYIFEFKVVKKNENMEKKAKEALKQIMDKEYYKELQLDGVQNIITSAVIFQGKTCIVRQNLS